MKPRLRLSLSLLTLGTTSTIAISAPRSIVFILSDDHRYDAMGFMGHSFLKTPHLDSLAKNGVHARNACVTTALCSPSRASILTGLYAHHHGVVDNNNPVRADLVFFPELLQQAGYTTGFFGKWHMGGESAMPQRGFDKWVSFSGQGTYWPDGRGTVDHRPSSVNLLNVDGRTVPQKGYITDELTEYALDWLKTVPSDQPFLLYLSHKATHAEFVPADRHLGRYKDKSVPPPDSQHKHDHAPMWVQNQRNSWHGADHPFLRDLDLAGNYRLYCETLLAVDESIGRVLAALRERGQLDDTLVVYMGDNGFGFGDHGLIDKRTAYDWSMRVPLLMQCPSALPAGLTLNEVVANIDIAPTLLEFAGVAPDLWPKFDGQSFLSGAQGRPMEWREGLLYEYYWERNFPQTPTIFALRTTSYKFVRAHGLWDIDELYDLQQDPNETNNLIFDRSYASIADSLRKQLFELLQETGGMSIPIQPDRGRSFNQRRRDGSPAADFPPEMVRDSSGT